MSKSTDPCDSTGTISHHEASEMALLFINSHFRKPGDRPRTSIPCDPSRDHDVRLLAYIKQQREKDAELARLREAARQKHEWEEMAEHAGLPMSPHEARACVENLRSERDLAVKELESLVGRLCLQSPYEGCRKVSLDSAREALKRLKGERR